MKVVWRLEVLNYMRVALLLYNFSILFYIYIDTFMFLSGHMLFILATSFEITTKVSNKTIKYYNY